MRAGREPENRLARAHYLDAGLYDKRYGRRRDDVAFYVGQAKRAKGLVLELGAGTGRLTLPMLEAGAQVVALEREPTLLEVLRQRARGAKVVKGDFLRPLPKGKFALVVAPFNAFSHVHDGLVDVLKRIHKQARRVVFDVPMPDPDAMRRDPERQYRVGSSVVEGVRYQYSESFDYDAAKQTMLTLAHYDVDGDPSHPKSFVLPLLHRLYFPQELAALCRLAGFRVLQHSGDFAGGPLTAESASQVIVMES